MTNGEYLAIFKDLGLERTSFVRMLERQIALLAKNGLHREAEEGKWIVIHAAEVEKSERELTAQYVHEEEKRE